MSTLRPLAIAVLALASLGFTGCGQRDVNQKGVEVQELRRENEELRAALAAAQERQAIATVRETGGSEEGIERALGPGVTSDLRDKERVFSIENSILFRPGSAELSGASATTLGRVVGVIKAKYPNHYVRVEGHTDNQPVTRTKDKWEDNWGLSAGRALAVVRFLQKQGIPAGDLGIAGYGEQRPLAPNANEAAKQKNRRVEIVVIPKH